MSGPSSRMDRQGVFGVVGDGDDSGFGGDAFRSLFMVQPRMVMKSVPTPKASALALKQHTLPSIQECILPKQPNLESPMLGCNLEDEVWSFNSIASRDNAHFDPSWQRFLKNFDASAFAQDRREDNLHVGGGQPSAHRQESISNEIMPFDTDDVADVMYHAVSDVAEAYEEGNIVTGNSNDEPYVTEHIAIRRKDAGQKREKTKGGGRLATFSRKTVPVTEIGDDQDSPFGRLSAPFDHSVLPVHDDVMVDEVAVRSPSWRIGEAQDHIEEQNGDPEGKDSSSSGSSFRSRLRWLAAHPSSSLKSSLRKKGSMPNLNDDVAIGKTDTIRKVAGVHDGSKKRRSQSERWIRV